MELDGLGRFGDPAVLILSSLAGGPKHGYALIKDIDEFAGVTLGPGTLYGALGRLEERGLVEPLPAEDRRRPYRMTAAGADALREYLRHARTVTTVGLRRLAMP
jgi:DNA-binding PadR family transcriptional regulator